MSSNSEKKESVKEIRVVLDLETLEKLEFCKKVSGIQALTDFMRHLINKEYDISLDHYTALLLKEKEVKKLQKETK